MRTVGQGGNASATQQNFNFENEGDRQHEFSRTGVMNPKAGRLQPLNPSSPSKRAQYAEGGRQGSGDSPQRVIDGFGAADTNEIVDANKQYEGTVYLKTKVGTLKKHLMILIGNEIYFFRSRQDN